MIRDKKQNPAIGWLDKEDGIFHRKEKETILIVYMELIVIF